MTAIVILALLGVTPRVTAAPKSMLQTAPTTEQVVQAPKEEKPRRFGWMTKWFRSGDDKKQAAEQLAKAEADVLAAYQAPPSKPQATPGKGMDLQVGAPPSASATTTLAGSPAADVDCKALRNAGHQQDRTGNLAGAERLYRQAIAANPKSAAAVNDLGLCLARQGRLQESVAAFEQAIAMQPEKLLYRNNIATVLVETGHPEEALDHLVKVNPPATAHYNLGKLISHTGNHQLATVHLQQAAQLDPRLAPAVAQATPTRVAALPQQAAVAPVAKPEPPVAQPVTPAVEPSTTPSLPRLLPPVL